MIGSIRGQLLAHEKDPDRLLLEVAGIGYWVQVTSQSLAKAIGQQSPGSATKSSKSAKSAKAAAGPELFYYTEQVVREDSISLYGFDSQVEQQSFAILIGISGIGPQMALGVLSTFSPQELQTVLLDEDIDSLCLVPGIGPKRARQLLVVLKDRFAISDAVSSPALQPDSARAEARVALAELGYSSEEIHLALSDAAKEAPEDADTELLVKAALARLAK